MTTSRSEAHSQEKTSTVSTTKKIGLALLEGALATAVPSPVINAFNRISVVASRESVSDARAAQMIYRGEIPRQASMSKLLTKIIYRGETIQQISMRNFLTGIDAHFVKEGVRLGFKMPGLSVYLPYLKAHYDAQTANYVYALTMAGAEFLVNPADTWRVMSQSGDGVKFSLRSLYAGAPANSVRQFITWAIFGYTNKELDPLISGLGIDPISVKGALVKTFPQSLAITATVYGIERIKNEMQFKAKNNIGYINAAKEILIDGLLYKGFFAKLTGNTIQNLFALLVMNAGINRAKVQAAKVEESHSLTLKR